MENISPLIDIKILSLKYRHVVGVVDRLGADNSDLYTYSTEGLYWASDGHSVDSISDKYDRHSARNPRNILSATPIPVYIIIFSSF